MTNLDAIDARIAAGEPVTASELAEAKASDELATRQALAEADAQHSQAESARHAAIDDVISRFAADVDAAAERLRVHVDAVFAARDAVVAEHRHLEELAAGHLAHLNQLGHRVHRDDIMNALGGRVLLDFDQLNQGIEIELPTSSGFWWWRHRRLEECAGDDPSMPIESWVDPHTGLVHHRSVQ